MCNHFNESPKALKMEDEMQISIDPVVNRF